MSKTQEVAIHVTSLMKRLRSELILQGLDFQAHYGDVVVIVGANGSGKTLLLRILSGLVYADGGMVQVGATTLRKTWWGIVPQDVGVMIEQPGFLPYLRGRDNLRLLARLRQRIPDESVTQAMEEVGLDPHSRKKVRQYSLGMRQRLAIAQAFMEQPQIVLLDEPTNGIDPDYLPQFLSRVRDYADQGRAVVITTHELAHFAPISDQILTLRQGRLESRQEERS